MGLLRPLLGLLIVNLGVHADLRLVLAPLSHEKLVFVMVEVTALAFSQSVDPVALKVISIPLSQDTVTVALAFVPLAFINVFGRVDHSAFTLRLAVDPISVVTISVRVEEGTAAVTSVFVPVTGVFTSEFTRVASPLSALSVLLVNSPHAFVFVSVFIILNAEAFLAVVSPVSDVPGRAFPLLAFYSSVLLFLLLFHPVH